jgi:hypothetical protein
VSELGGAGRAATRRASQREVRHLEDDGIVFFRVFQKRRTFNIQRPTLK